MNNTLNQKLNSLINIRKSFLERINNYSEEQLLFKINNNEWNILEVLDHVSLSEKLVIKLFKKYPPAETKYKVTLSSKLKNKALSLFYKSSKKVKMPMNTLAPRGNVSLGDLNQEMEDQFSSLQEYCENHPEEKMNYSVFKHPVSGGMTMENTVQFFEQHIIHHIHQLNKIEKDSNFPKK